MSKTLGQINENAFLEKWHTIPDDTKVGVGRLICFEAAAEAVVEEVSKPFPANAVYAAEYEVTKAAEALVADLGMLEGCELPFPLHKLIHAQREAVEALQEARDE